MRSIKHHLKILDPDNSIENQKRERLFLRADFLAHQARCELAKIKRRKFRIVS